MHRTGAADGKASCTFFCSFDKLSRARDIACLDVASAAFIQHNALDPGLVPGLRWAKEKSGDGGARFCEMGWGEEGEGQGEP